MKLTINTESRVLTTEVHGISRDLPLYSREAFDLVSREWVRIGSGVDYYFTLKWFGRAILQLPDDLVRLQEVLATLQPDVIVETGINHGGSLLFHATICEGLGRGCVIGIDIRINDETRDRLSMIEADSAAPETFETVRGMVNPGETTLRASCSSGHRS